MTSTKPATPQDLKRLYRALASLANEQAVAALLEDICTIREIDEMAQRLFVAQLLAEEHSYTYISEQTGASATTIARVSKALNHGAGGYRRVLDREKSTNHTAQTNQDNQHNEG
ncbi:MAG: YerC/YecD family TrpR-related protein [Coriobacteriia bacterium]|nr:YerC/YecD family TrpR-related protein [Coriobacteriia bacterium]